MTYRPPALAERILSWLLLPEDAESVLGDFAEVYHLQGDQKQADIWYLKETLRSFPALFRLKMSRQLERGVTVMTNNLQQHNKNFLWVSLLALIPALLLIVPGIFQSLFGYMALNNAMDGLYVSAPYLEILRSPVLLLGGLLLALILNLLSALNLRFERQPEGLIGVITFKPVLIHWAFIGMSLLMVGVILIYAFFENFGPI